MWKANATLKKIIKIYNNALQVSVLQNIFRTSLSSSIYLSLFFFSFFFPRIVQLTQVILQPVFSWYCSLHDIVRWGEVGVLLGKMHRKCCFVDLPGRGSEQTAEVGYDEDRQSGRCSSLFRLMQASRQVVCSPLFSLQLYINCKYGYYISSVWQRKKYNWHYQSTVLPRYLENQRFDFCVYSSNTFQIFY